MAAAGPSESSTGRGVRRPTFTGFARGWFVISFSDELTVGAIKTLNYFGQRLVLFRGDNGAAVVQDGYCPHLGANLGDGTVVGDTIRCPFHGWQFDGEGRCVAIPYSEKIPKRAVNRVWETCELNGMIYLWHDPDGGPPTWSVPVLEAWGDDDWIPWRKSLIHIKTQPREIVENVVDKGHFGPVHNTHVDTFENHFVDHTAVQRTAGVAYPQGGGKDNFTITATYYGPAFQVSQMSGFMESRLINAHVPIDEHSLDLRFGVMLKIKGNVEQTESIAEAYIDNLTKGFFEDVAIWEGKLWRDVPLLCEGDGPIMKLRKWYAQFFSNAGGTDQ